MWNVVFNQQYFIFSVFVAEWTKRPDEVSLRITRVSRPLIQCHDDPLSIQFLSLSCFDSDARNFSLCRDKDVSSGALENRFLNNSAILTPLSFDNSDDSPCWPFFLFVWSNLQQGFRFLLDLHRIIYAIFSFVFQHYLAWRRPFFFRKNLNRYNISINSTIKRFTSLNKNLKKS